MFLSVCKHHTQTQKGIIVRFKLFENWIGILIIHMLCLYFMSSVLFSGDDGSLYDVGKLSQKLKSAIENENIRFVEQSSV